MAALEGGLANRVVASTAMNAGDPNYSHVSQPRTSDSRVRMKPRMSVLQRFRL